MGTEDRGFARPMSAYLAMAFALSGDADAAVECERRATAASAALDGIFAVDTARSRAWTLVARGEMTGAAEQLRAAARLAAARNQPAYEAVALHDLARFGCPAEAADRLEQLAGVVDGALVDAFAAHAHALAIDDGTALDAVGATFQDLALELFAAEAFTAAASAHRRAGLKARASASREQARVIIDRCEHPQTPTLIQGDAGEQLTARERRWASSPRTISRAGRSRRGSASRRARSTTCSAACTRSSEFPAARTSPGSWAVVSSRLLTTWGEDRAMVTGWTATKPPSGCPRRTSV